MAPNDIVKLALQMVSWVALVGTILPPVLFSFGQLELPTSNWLMLCATIGWFVAMGILVVLPRLQSADTDK